MTDEASGTVIPFPGHTIPESSVPLAGNGGGDIPGGMDARVARLETHMEYVRENLTQIKSGQEATQNTLRGLTSATEKLTSEAVLSEVRLTSQMRELPTKDDLKSYNLQLIGIGIAILILVVTGIAGALIFVKHN